MDFPPEFSDNEVREELARLGYTNIPNDKLREFRKDLDQLIRLERSKGSSVNSSFSFDLNYNMTASADPTGISHHDDTELSRHAEPSSESGGLWSEFTNKGGSIPVSSAVKKNDIEPSDLGAKVESLNRPKSAPVPGYYSLYEMSTRMQVKSPAVRDDMSETDSERRRLMKRKTLRKNHQGSKFIDETVSESDNGSIGDAQEMVDRLVLHDLDNGQEFRRCHSARSAQEPPPYRLSPSDPRLPSVIYSMEEHPHTKNLRRMDPVNRYHEMKQAWSLQKAPGEKLHKRLRWNIREQMLVQEIPEKKQHKIFVPNSYVVPTEKKRSALCWQIRMDMAQGNMPACGVFHDF